MVEMTRSATLGNTHVDYTKIRESLASVSPGVRATLRNATPRNGTSPSSNEIKGNDTINPFKLDRLSNMISNNINAVNDLRAITPYIDKAELIWNTIMFFPNGRQEKVITYDTQTTKYKSTLLHAELLKIWDNYYTNDYKIEQDLLHWNSDILWNTGSVTLFNLSRAGLDYLINGSVVDPNKTTDKTDDRSGNEAFRAEALEKLSQSFQMVNGKYITKNIGKRVRDPSKADAAKLGGRSGLEQLLSGSGSYSGLEFNIFNGVKGKDYSEESKPEVDLSDFFNITFTDNPDILYLQKFNEKARDNDVESIMGLEDLGSLITSVPDFEETPPQPPKNGKKPAQQKKRGKDEEQLATAQLLTEAQMENVAHAIFPGRHIRHQSMQYVKTNDSLSVQPYGRGLRWHVPSEAVIPIHYNGRNREKMDFIFLLDDQGNFLKSAGDDSFYQVGANNQGKNQSVQDRPTQGSTDQLISSLRIVQQGKPCDFDMTEFAELAKTSIIKQFVQAVISGTGDNISITLDEETNKIFLARMFRRQGVRCLYVPGEAVTYMAYKYNRLGMGQSLTQMAKMHIARLAAFDFADALANLEAAQPHSMMTITPEQLDGDPHQTVAIARAKFFQSNPRLHSLLSSAQLSVPQIADALRESSLTIKVNASENPNMPAPEIDLQRMDKEHFKPIDDASRQKVLNDVANYFHLPRKWLDVSDDSNDFQIEAITEHEMVHNQGANWQTTLMAFVIDHERKHARVNVPFMQQLVRCIKENKKLWTPDSKTPFEVESDNEKIKIILTDFLSSVFGYLPDATSTESTDKLKAQLEAVDALVKAWDEMSGNTVLMGQMIKILGINTERFSSDEIKATLKAVFMTEAFRRYNLPMPFDDMVNDGKGGGIASLVNNIIHQRNNVTEFITKLYDEMEKTDSKAKKHLKKLVERLNAADNPEEPENADGLDADGNPIVPAEGGEVPGSEDGLLPDDGNAPPMPGEEPNGEEEEEEDEGAPPMPGDGESAADGESAPPMPGDESGDADADGKDPEHNPF